MKDKSYKTIIKIIVNAIKMVVLVELVWIFIQLLLYRLFGVDINQLIFVDLLHLVENALYEADLVSIGFKPAFGSISTVICHGYSFFLIIQ